MSCARHPVLLVPGLGASQMTAKYINKPDGWQCHAMNKSFPIWFNPKLFLPFTYECIINLLKLEYNKTSHSTSSPKYGVIDIPGFETIDTIAYISTFKIPLTAYYNNIIEELTGKHNYTKNVDIRGAPYDFRKGPGEMDKYLTNVRKLIEEMYWTSNRTSVVIIAHSLGNLFILTLLNRMSQEWKDQYIRSFISVSAPYAGAVTAGKAILSGFKARAFYLNTLKIREMESTWPSLYYLLPVPGMWPDGNIVLTKTGNFTAKNISDLMKLSKIKNAPNIYDDVINHMNIPRAPNVETHCVFSLGLPTEFILDYREVEFPDMTPRIIHSNGDCRVPVNSLMVCPQWKSQQRQQVTLQTIDGVRHLEMIKHRFLIEFVGKYITRINS